MYAREVDNCSSCMVEKRAITDADTKIYDIWYSSLGLGEDEDKYAIILPMERVIILYSLYGRGGGKYLYAFI